jgi:hypothetical protein
MIVGRLRIRQPADFGAVAQQYPIASIYYYSVMDCLFDLAHQVSKDFMLRPHLYFSLADPAQPGIPISAIMGELYAGWGTKPSALNKSQRMCMYNAVFGSNAIDLRSSEAEFPRLASQLLEASARFAERVFYGGEQMLQEAAVSAHYPLRRHLDKLAGDSVVWARDFALEPHSAVSYAVLRNRGVAAVFGVSTAPNPAWPYVEDANGDILVSEISKQLITLSEGSVGRDEQIITRDQFGNLQRAALRGAEALAAILRFNEAAAADDDERIQNANVVISACYSWGAALKDVKSQPPLMQSAAETPVRRVDLSGPLVAYRR